MMKKEQIGSSLDDWLHEEGIYEETTSVAIKRVLARQLRPAKKLLASTRHPDRSERTV
jgi:hypothetical protein